MSARHKNKTTPHAELTDADRTLLRQLPLHFEYDKVQPHKTLIDTFHKLRRLGLATMQFGEVARKDYPNAMTASLLAAYGAAPKKAANMKLIDRKVTTLHVAKPYTPDPAKLIKDAVNDAAKRIEAHKAKRVHTKKSCKQFTLVTSA